MPEVLDMAGPILEVLTWLCLPLGIILWVAAAVVARFQVAWISTQGVVYQDDGGIGVRWFDHLHEVHSALLEPGDARGLKAGHDLVVYYERRDPSLCRTTAPDSPGEPFLVVGRLLTAIGVAALASGFVLPLF
ncbi:hypothetical protein [Arthrobacter sp. ISL-30]|uniref:hypothetical protein n=1 Tax=Arthrobacter sp. ISL-30 TaxID=2819109 RepID=UPI001BEA037C|nr:hypothetical protein [Arthrobacter sp. ISL-30]MBT2514995.1 hypothetical protein [Arthrobacter sp. ISL-30]